MSAEEVLGKHQWLGGIVGCGCGWKWPEERTYFCGEDERIAKAHIAHQLVALQAAGYAVVELPEPKPIHVVAIDMQPVDDDGEPVDPELTIRFNGIPKPGRLFDRRDLAAALLAADAAEGLS